MLSNDSMQKRLARATILAALLVAGTIALPAQNASSYVPSLVVSSTNPVPATGLPGGLGDVALDGCGNIYTVNQGSGQVVEIPSGGGTASIVLGAASYGTASLWIDAAKANLFVLQGYAGSVTQIPLVGCVPNTSAQTSIGIGNLGAISYYWGGSAEATDAAENLFIATSGACCASANELLEQYASGKYGSGTTLLTGLANPITSIAVDASGNLYYVSGGALYQLQVTTAATSSAPATYSSTPSSLGSGYNNVVGVAIDGAGDLYVADGGASTIFEIPFETKSSGSTLNPADQFIVATGVSITNTPGVGATGAIYLANQGASVYALTRFSASVGQVAVGSSGTFTLDAVFNGAMTPGALAIFPGGGLFTQTGGTCVAGNAYAAGSSCTMVLSFNPALPGVVNGGAMLLPSSGTTPLATIYLSGQGLGAGLTLDPGTVATTGSGFKTPDSVTLDAAGDVFYADAGANAVLEFTPGSTTAVSIGTGLSKPAGVAVDGAGNVFIADTGNNRIVEVPMVSGALSNTAQTTVVAAENAQGTATPIAGAALNAPAGLAIDGAGNLFIADTANNRIVAIPYNGALNPSAAVAIGSSLTGPLAVVANAAGNLYVADSGAGQIYEIFLPLSEPSQQLVAVGFGNPTGLAVDASGSLFVADQGDGDVVRIPNISGNLEPNDEVEAGIGIGTPYGVAVDPSGNLYVSGSSAAAYKVTRTSTTLAFGDWALSTTSGVLSAQVEDSGNQALTLGSSYFSASGDTGDFSVSATGPSACAASGTVATGDSCELDATFTPSAPGTRTDTLVLSSNAANTSSSQVTLTGNGAAVASTTTTLSITSPTSGTPSFGQPITVSATVAATSGTPSGNVILVVDGVQIGDAALNSSGVASFDLASGLTGGGHTLIAVYNGTATFDGSVSPALQLTVGKTSTTVALAVATPYTSPYSALAGTAISFTATIGFPGVGIPTGTVTFEANGTALGTAPVEPAAGGLFEATLSTSSLVAGTYTVVASYSGDPNYVGSTSGASSTIYVVSSASVTVTSSGSSISSSASTNGTLTFNATSYGGWTGMVGFGCVASSLPANARCVFSPGQIEVVPGTSSSAASNPTVNLTVTIDQPPQTPTAGKLYWWIALPTGLLLLFARRRWMRGGWVTIATVLALTLLGSSTAGLIACTSGSATVTPAGTSTISVVASSDPFAAASTTTTQSCPANDPASAPCAQTAFSVSLTVH